jgi:ubiquinone/menaquinone biosynthesis C-methylase UbiE
LSRKQNIDKVFSLDMSEQLLTVVAPEVMKYLCEDTSKITRIVGGFNDLLIFPDYSFDFVMFNDAVHHIPVSSYSRYFKKFIVC